MNLLQATEKVFREQGKPLHYREITQIILEKGLWGTKGKTPETTPEGRMNGEQLVKLLLECEVGARRTQLYLIDLEIPVIYGFGVTKE